MQKKCDWADDIQVDYLHFLQKYKVTMQVKHWESCQKKKQNVKEIRESIISEQK